MAGLTQDVRLGFRSLIRRPAISVTAVVALAIGIGANSATFSVVNAVLLRPLPFPSSERIIAVWSSPLATRERWTSAYPDVADWKLGAQSVQQLAAYAPNRSVLQEPEGPTPLFGTAASADLFPLLRVDPVLGRAFTAEEDRAGAPPVVLLSFDTWQRHFRSDPRIVGSAIALGDRSATVIGVMPAGFVFPTNRPRVDYYTPLVPAIGEKATHRSDMFLRCIARLADGATVADAQSELVGIAARLAAAYPDSSASRTVWVTPLRDDLVGNSRPALLVLFGAVVLVLLIACANVANLLLSSATARRREIAVRSALGASRSRIARHVLVETAILAIVGGGLGLVLSTWIVDGLLALQPAGVPRLSEVHLDATVIAFTLGASIVVTLAAGLAPAMHGSRADITDALKSGGRSGSDGRGVTRMRSALVVFQIAVSAVLLVGAGLLVRSFVALRHVDPGFDGRGVLIATLTPAATKLADVSERNRYFQRVLDRLRETPGVESAASVSPIPFGGSESDTTFAIVGQPPVAIGHEPIADYRVASSGYFSTLRIPIVNGRDFSSADNTSTAAPVVLVNAAFARRYFPDEDPIGHALVIGADPIDNPNPPAREIVGVVGDTHHTSLNAAPVPEMYIPFAQEKWPTIDLVIRPRAGVTDGFSASIADAIRSVDPLEYAPAPRALSDLVEASTSGQAFSLVLLGCFALIALVLATVGIYGVVSYSVVSRSHEIGIRMALGATTQRVVRQILGGSVVLAVVGLSLGFGGAWALARAMNGMLFGVAATDLATFTVVSCLLMAVTCAASALPARRASRIDPKRSLSDS